MAEPADGWSLGEIATLASRAARGAGLVWGLAEEAGWAVRWLGAQGLGAEAASGLAECLTSAQPGRALRLGTGIADRGQAEPLTLDPVAGPILLIPYLSLVAARLGAGVRLRVNEAVVSIGPSGCVVAGDLPGTGRVVVAPGALPETPVRVTRVPVPDTRTEAALRGLAARTYAPPTEASRRSGAGAGLTDND